MTFKRITVLFVTFLQVFLFVNIQAIGATGTTESRYYFTLWLRTGETIEYLYNEHPRVIPSEEFLIIYSTQGTMLYAQKDVHKFTTRRKTDEETTSIEHSLNKDTKFIQSGDLVHLSCFRPESIVRIFSVNGKLLQTNSISYDGTLTLDISNLNRGIFVISTDGITFKILKK